MMKNGGDPPRPRSCTAPGELVIFHEFLALDALATDGMPFAFLTPTGWQYRKNGPPAFFE
jgi:hypothetical protein